jgi:thymidylate synthase (FAD)
LKVEYIDHMGSDLTCVNAARVSFDKESDWERVPTNPDYDPLGIELWSGEKLSSKDQKLISYLAKHNHWTPFSHVMITMRETVPIFVARQRFKHMVGFTYNEVSRRYVDDAPEFFTPDVWRSRPDGSVKQGSGDPLENDDFGSVQDYLNEQIEEYHKYCLDTYNDMLRAGVAPEQARMVLPQSMYTSYYVTGSLAAWARAYQLRIDEHAQKEIQDLAKMWGDIIGNIPELKYSWDSLTNN